MGILKIPSTFFPKSVLRNSDGGSFFSIDDQRLRN